MIILQLKKKKEGVGRMSDSTSQEQGCIPALPLRGCEAGAQLFSYNGFNGSNHTALSCLLWLNIVMLLVTLPDESPRVRWLSHWTTILRWKRTGIRCEKHAHQPKLKEWRHKLPREASFNDSLAAVWWAGTPRALTHAGPSPSSSLTDYCGVNNHLGLIPPSLWAGPSLTSSFLLSCRPIPVLMFWIYQ